MIIEYSIHSRQKLWNGLGFSCDSYPVGMRGQYIERIATVHRWVNQRRCTHRAKVTQECIFSLEAVDIDINALNAS